MTPKVQAGNKPEQAGQGKRSSSKLTYMSGFGNHFESEAREGALPKGQNSPQEAGLGLYAEQLSGSSFTAQRHENQRSWLYRILPSVVQGRFKPVDAHFICSKPFDEVPPIPDQLRWDPLPIPEQPTEFLAGLKTIAGNGGYGSYKGCAVHIYATNRSMSDSFFYNADGELLFVPESGDIELRTEFGIIHAVPGEIAVVQRGIKFQVVLPSGQARGYLLENYGPPLRLPQLGPIGSNGLANPRDFQTPVAAFEQKTGKFKLLCKFQGRLFEASIDHSPLDVVAWHGNYAPYKYDLALFNTVNTVSFDHSDPSIFTVLTSPSEMPGIANVDFVIFPPRWLVAEHTFRPPYFHRNVMSEYMGLIFGQYDAKAEGFVPGGGSLHNAMSAHGPDAATYKRASTEKLEPKYQGDTLAFMFESSLVFRPTAFALKTEALQKDYSDCWQGLKANFKD
jgi:homogentisate 1,2-dioxygenase